MNQEYVKVYSCNGQLDADMIKIFLESMEINAIISRESVGGIYGLSVGPLGEVDILVPREQYDLTVDILTRMENGEFEVQTKDENDLDDLEADKE
jgi:L-cysteine desulfidase